MLVSPHYSADIFEFHGRNPSELLWVYFKRMFLPIDFGDIPAMAAQDIVNVLKQGYLEKKRKGI